MGYITDTTDITEGDVTGVGFSYSGDDTNKKNLSGVFVIHSKDSGVSDLWVTKTAFLSRLNRKSQHTLCCASQKGGFCLVSGVMMSSKVCDVCNATDLLLMGVRKRIYIRKV